MTGSKKRGNFGEPSPKSPLWIVVIEWEGAKPPTRFYRYAQRMLRGTDDTYHISKRQGRAMERSGVALWAQEGVYILADRERAGLLVALAQEVGAERAWLIEAPGFQVVLDEDRLAARLLMQRWSKRGPRPDRTTGWEERDISEVIALARQIAPDREISENFRRFRSLCLDCRYVWESTGPVEPLGCPSCGSTEIASREI